MNTAVQKLQDSLNASFDAVDKAIANIVQDEVNFANEIRSLKDSIANNQNSTLSTEDQQALDSLVGRADKMAAKAREVADSVPDAPDVTTVLAQG